MTRTPGVMVSGPVIRFELKDGRIVREYFYGPKTTKDVELPADVPIPGWGLTVAEEPSWLKALHDSCDSPLVFVKEVPGLTPEDWQAKAPGLWRATTAYDHIGSRHRQDRVWFMCTRVSANSHDQLRDTIWPEIAHAR